MTITFRLVEETDFPLLHTWFKMPHVTEWWPVPQEREAFFTHFLPRIRDGIRHPYLVFYDDKPIGYIQWYVVDPAKSSWLPPLPDNTVGIDQFIGDPMYLYKGIGQIMIKEFMQLLMTSESTASSHSPQAFIVDPDPTNRAAIRCYEKVGFKKLGEYQAPWGHALVMVYP